MNNILIPTDFSDNAWNALDYAVSFFKKEECSFYLLHVSASEMVASGITSEIIMSPFEEKTTVSKRFTDLREKIKQFPTNKKHHFFTLHEYGYLVDTIRNIVAEKSIDYIVMGTKGASGWKERTIGSNTGDVITKVKCPILVIPEKATYIKPIEIAFPTDYNLQYRSKVLNTIRTVVATSDANFRILHIAKKEKELSELQKENKNLLDDYLGDTLKHSFHFLSTANIEEGVQSFVESSNINMITMIAKNVNFFQRILFRPTVEKISYHTHIPFFVLHE
ncbi:universal stress protein [Aquimarina litoralis]